VGVKSLVSTKKACDRHFAGKRMSGSLRTNNQPGGPNQSIKVGQMKLTQPTKDEAPIARKATLLGLISRKISFLHELPDAFLMCDALAS
jgi:hypothetical protein